MPNILYAMFVVAGVFLSAGSVAAATAEDFKTQEYNKSTALDSINAAEAYARGYTGAGVTVGVIDEMVRIDHPELLGKAATATATRNDTGKPYVPIWKENLHGSHVAGIIGAKRDAVGMHGVAFDASIWGGPILATENDKALGISLDFTAYVAAHPETRIFNNSWGPKLWIRYYDPQQFGTGADLKEVTEIMKSLATDADWEDEYNLASHARDHQDAVIVFAAGNDGMDGPDLPGMLPRYAGSDLYNWINVGNIDSNANLWQTDIDGKINKLELGAVNLESNLAAGAERWTAMAPGTQINSLDAAKNDYISKTGTSMATPAVSGALALVQQAYPWMTGKQLADAVLTTANNKVTLPQYILSVGPELDANNKEAIDKTAKVYIRVVKDGGYVIPTAKDEKLEAAKKIVKELFDNYGITDEDDQYAGYNIKGLNNIIDGKDVEGSEYASKGVEFIPDVTREQIIGRGILDVGKAVRGIALLDANRMNEKDVHFVNELGSGTRHALETFNTKGYSGEFSNNIDGLGWDDNFHHKELRSSSEETEENKDARTLKAVGENVGLRKIGAGTLVLSGFNEYKGATVVEGGNLVIANQKNSLGKDIFGTGILASSSIIVRPGGTLMGDGVIVKKVYNNGIVQPGWWDDTLTVGNYEQSANGALHITFDPQGKYGKLKATTSATLGGQLLLRPQQNLFYANGQAWTQPVLSIEDGVTLEGKLSQVSIENVSPTLQFTFDNRDSTGQPTTWRMDRAANAYSRHARNGSAANVGRALPGIAATAQGDIVALLTALDWSSPDGSDVRRGLTQLSSEAYDIVGQVSLAQQKTLSNQLLRRMLAQESLRRMTHSKQGDTQHAVALSAGKAISGQTAWQAWLTPFASSAVQYDHGDTAGWAGNSMGLLGGIEHRWDTGMTLGMHMALAGRQTDSHGGHHARVETRGAYVGGHALYSPDFWDGFYLTGQARLGVEDNTMRRDITFNGYARSNESQWTSLTGSAMLGAGKDWTWNNFCAGPLGWFEYSFVQRPEITEDGGQATRLNVDGGINQALSVALGGHVGYAWEISEKTTLALDGLLAWRHELLDGTMRSKASFRGYEAASFDSSSDLVGRDAVLAQTSLRVTHEQNFFAQVDLGGEAHEAGSSLTMGLSFGVEF